MVKNSDFLGSMNSKPYYICHYDLIYFALKVNGKQITTGSLLINMCHEKSYVMGN